MATYPPQSTEPVETPAPLGAAVLSAPMHQQRLAWMVLWAAFAAFLALAVFGVLGMKAFVERATEPQDGLLTTISGTAQVRAPRQTQWSSVDAETRLREGDRVRTDGVSQAFLTLFDRSTVQVFAGTELEVVQSAIASFGGDRRMVELRLLSGKVHLGVSPEAKRTFRLTTRDGHVRLGEGSYTVTQDGLGTRVRVAERGQAVASVNTDSGNETILTAGVRADLRADGLRLVGVGPENLVFNGDFAQGVSGWRAGHEAGYQPGLDVPGQQALATDEGRLAAHFFRRGSKGTHSETLLVQDLDKDATEYSDLRLALDMKLSYQSLSGGGYVGTEYPVLVRLVYRSANTETPVVFGFYYQNADNNRVDNGTPIPQNTWVHHAIPLNLMTLFPPPQRLLSLQVTASGHDYESFITNVSLTAQ
ncbi:MAG: hypothetical protein EXR52_07880 [Dehalococcoidia bacterium]|nr:hypothetical protein [Dehalococcoidia bacterium]